METIIDIAEMSDHEEIDLNDLIKRAKPFLKNKVNTLIVSSRYFSDKNEHY